MRKSRRALAFGGVVCILAIGLSVAWTSCDSLPDGPVLEPDGAAAAPLGSRERVDARDTPDAPDAPAPSETSPEDSDLPGRITVLLADGAPAEGAEVEYLRFEGGGLAAADLRPRALGRTDARGVLAWPDVDLPLPGVVRASHPDHAPGATPVNQTAADVVVQLTKGFVVAGQVVTTDDTPVQGARVELRVLPTRHAFGGVMGVVGTWTRRAVTGHDGAFELRGTPPAMFGVLHVDADGFATARRHWGARDGRVRVRLHRQFESIVRLVDGTGRPVPDGTVAAVAGPLFRANGDGVTPAVTAFTQRASLEHVRDDLPPGWYTLFAAAPGHVARVVEDIGLGPAVGPVDVVLERCDGLEGRVVDAESGEPIAGARVVVAPLAPNVRAGSDDEWRHQRHAVAIAGPHAVQTREDGTFRAVVTGPGGAFGVYAVAPGYAPSQQIVRAAAVDALNDLRLRPLVEVELSGRVVAEDGPPVPGALIQGRHASVVADADGRFVLSTTQDGLSVVVLAPGFAARAVIAESARADLGEIELTPVLEIPGRVVDESGQPVAGLPLYVEPVGRPALPPGTIFFGASEVSAADGSAVATVTVGDAYRIRPPSDSRSGETTVVGGEDTSFRLVVGGGGHGERGSIVGRLEMADGTWLRRRAVVALRSDDRPSPGLVGTALPDGSFEIDLVPAGEWDLVVWGAGVSGNAYDVEVPVAGAVSVQIVCEEVPDDDVERAIVAVTLEDRPKSARVWMTRQPAGTSRRATLGSAGAWTTVGEAEGTYSVWAYDREGGTAAVSSGVLAGDEPHELRLAAAGRLFLPPRDVTDPEHWLELTDVSGTRVWFGPHSALPGVPGEGHYLPLPPGDWTIEIGLGRARKSRRLLRGTVRGGDATHLE